VNDYAFLVNKMNVGILGASGYAGRELCALVASHPRLELAFATANEQRGLTVPAYPGGPDITFLAPEDAPLGGVDLVFSALPHGASYEWASRARRAGARVVDLSADMRPGNDHAGPVYGLTELARDALAGADVVANPGCYPTAILLALAPLLRNGLIAQGSAIVIDAASGVTGAGNSPKRELLFAEIGEDYRAYGVGNGHRHLNEMRSTVYDWGADVDLIFTPHLLPVSRGILASITVQLTEPLSDAMAPWREMYATETFIELVSQPPMLRDVVRRNVVRIHATTLSHTRRPSLLVLSAIDNLVKGAAGQAVQNANVMLGFPEALGLPA
jgi:N-acetyl-gamma-glutamyl-phosphate reductase